MIDYDVITDNSVFLKECRKCKEVKPINEFHKDSASPDLHVRRCKSCAKAADSDRRFSNIKVYLEKERVKRECNKEKLRESCRRYYAENKEKYLIKKREYRKTETHRQKQREYYANNSKKAILATRLWQKSNPLKRKRADHDYRARKQSAVGTYAESHIPNLFSLQKGKCAICKKSISGKYEIDHIIPLCKGGTNYKDNLQLLCQHCNCSKGGKDPIEFMQQKGMLI